MPYTRLGTTKQVLCCTLWSISLQTHGVLPCSVESFDAFALFRAPSPLSRKGLLAVYYQKSLFFELFLALTAQCTTLTRISSHRLIACSYESLYIPNSIKVALAISHWELDIGHLGIRNRKQCFAWVTAHNSFPMPNCPMPKATFIELGIYIIHTILAHVNVSVCKIHESFFCLFLFLMMASRSVNFRFAIDR